MSKRRSFIFGLALAVAGLFGCRSEPPSEPRTGAIEMLVRGSAELRASGALTLSRADGSERWRLPLQAARWQTRRLSLTPGRYTLDFEPDLGRIAAGEAVTDAAATAALPRWVVVTPARVTSVVVQLELDQPTTTMASTTTPTVEGQPLN